MHFIASIGNQIRFGFLLLAMILLFVILINIWGANKISQINTEINAFRYPTAISSQAMVSGIYQVMAAKRGLLLFHDSHFIEESNIAWQHVDSSLMALQKLSNDWTNLDNVRRLKEIESNVKALKEYYGQIDENSISKEQWVNAIALLRDQVVPLTIETSKLLEDMVKNQNTMMTEYVAMASSFSQKLAYAEWAMLFAGCLLAFIISKIVTRKITDPIAKAVDSANRIANEDFEFVAEFKGSKEMQLLSESLNQMQQNLKKRRWLIASQLGLLETMSADLNVRQLSGAILTYLCKLLDAQLASFYLCQGETLKFVEGYAYHQQKLMEKSLNRGEGLVGEAARHQNLVHIKQVPESYFSIHSSLGNMLPSNLVILPVTLEQEVVCVLEFAGKTVFTQTQLEFLKQISRNIGISVNLCLSKEKTQKLLEEVQTQSEELMQANEELEQKSQELESQQAELEQTNEELEEQRTVLEEEKNKLELLTHSLESSRIQIEEKVHEAQMANRYKSEFLANMSHELRTPLNSIMILSQVLAENTNNNLDVGQIKNARTIYSAGSDLLALINDILDLSKVEAGKLEINVTKFTVESIIRNLQDIFEPQMQEKSLQFKVESNDNMHCALQTDQVRLEQILKNLVSNAMKFTEEGSVTVGFSSADGFLQVSVKDTGVGIPQDKHDFVFEAFKQIDSSLSRKYSGTGLGLSISQNLARKLGGVISLQSEIGKGSMFILRVPREYKASTATMIANENKSVTISDMGSPRGEIQIDENLIPELGLADDRNLIKPGDRLMLIIEDDIKFAEILMDHCHNGGFKCIYSNNGIQGLKDAATFLPQGILLDLRLPRLSGIEVLDRLKSDPKTRYIPVHVISVENRAKDVMSLGAIGFLEKPVSKAALDQAINEIEHLSSREAKNVLLVEDDVKQSHSITQLVGRGDIRVHAVETVSQALMKLGECHYDCVILDLKLKNETGFDFLEKLESDNTSYKPPIIVYTGKELQKDELTKLQNYADSIIIKSSDSHNRLLDEVKLFSHSIQKKHARSYQQALNKENPKEEIFRDKTILIVDDDMRNIYSLRQILLSRGINALQAHTGEEALLMIDQNPEINLVLMDVMMPGMNGIEAIKVVRKQPRYKQLPIIALTAKAMKQDREECLQAGASDYLSKPIDINQFFSLLRIWLSK